MHNLRGIALGWSNQVYKSIVPFNIQRTALYLRLRISFRIIQSIAQYRLLTSKFPRICFNGEIIRLNIDTNCPRCHERTEANLFHMLTECSKLTELRKRKLICSDTTQNVTDRMLGILSSPNEREIVVVFNLVAISARIRLGQMNHIQTHFYKTVV